MVSQASAEYRLLYKERTIMSSLIFSLFLFALFSMLLVIHQRQQMCQTEKANLKKASIT